MGCGTSKDIEENTFTDKRINGITKVPPTVRAHSVERPAKYDTEQADPLVQGAMVGIKEKIDAANNLWESQTKHVHELGAVNITENPLDGLENVVDIKKEEEEMADFLASEFKSLCDECEDNDLKEMRRIQTEMLGIADRGARLHTQVEVDPDGGEDVS